MLFNSHAFLFGFLPVAYGVYALLARRDGPRAALAWLALASLFFYGWWHPPFTLLLLASIAFNYGIGTALSTPAPEREGRRRLLLWIGVGGNLLLLGQFKYANFAVEIANQISGGGFAGGPIVLPLAISFFTFQQIAYLVDAHRHELRRQPFLHYLLFVSFFPQLIAGPIVHHRELIPQFARARLPRPTAQDLAIGITILVIGLFKKVVIADRIAAVADPVFAAAQGGAAVGFSDAWGGALAYTLQLYFDFSGYSDMAIGLAAMIGVRLPENFDSPYKARNIAEFWRRWHMTLSRFLRDYLYIPLGGNRRGGLRRTRNLLVTMLLGGLWHGAGWNFVLWGGLHGLYLVVHRAFATACRSAGFAEKGGALGTLAARGLTFLAVVVAWVLFRSPDLACAGSLLGAMAGLGGFAGPALTDAATPRLAAPVLDTTAGIMLVWLLAAVFLLPNTRELMARHRAQPDDPPPRPSIWNPSWSPSPQWAIALGLAGLASVLFMVERREFVYFQF